MNSELENIARSVIKYKLAWLVRRPESRYFFISIESKDPSPSFLKQLGNNIVGDSLAVYDKNAKNPRISDVIHKQTRKPGTKIYVRDLKLIEPNESIVTCGHHSGGMNSQSADYRLRKSGSRWVIVRIENIMKA